MTIVKPPNLSRHRASPGATATASVRRVAIPGINVLRELRQTLARGGLPPLDKRTPEDCARIASFRTILALLRLLDEFTRRVEAGEYCRLVEVERDSQPGRLLVEIQIEAQPR